MALRGAVRLGKVGTRMIKLPDTLPQWLADAIRKRSLEKHEILVQLM